MKKKNCDYRMLSFFSLRKFFPILADEELLSCLFELTIAGGVAIGHVLCYILMYVSMNPKVQEKMHEELDSVIADDALPTLRDKPRLSFQQMRIIESFFQTFNSRLKFEQSSVLRGCHIRNDENQYDSAHTGESRCHGRHKVRSIHSSQRIVLNLRIERYISRFARIRTTGVIFTGTISD